MSFLIFRDLFEEGEVLKSRKRKNRVSRRGFVCGANILGEQKYQNGRGSVRG